ncbi:sodium ion-translocating decarboxylase subunit beta [Marispirochaeta aestuarii]|uniref:sodium ion-translocating decarboxylase subunit beta n=1 Tax=Marispirochaeta aestuarii TaxID=1963862 RepID=UPI0029C677AB|nr:sodium ion-translocating decarboxylase subunit beta [Marispirochaeta aestuarii]
MNFGSAFYDLWTTTGLYGFMQEGGWQSVLMILVGFLLLYLAIKKGFEPLLLVPIGLGAILSNIPFAEIAAHTVITGNISETALAVKEISGGFIGLFYDFGIGSGLFPLLIFMGVGAMTDFGPLLADPKTFLLGAAAQFGIFVAVLGALFLGKYVPGINFDLFAAGSIGIIGGADGPTAIYVASRLKPELLGAIAVAAYSYMALVPIIQPPIMRLLTTKEERQIKMEQLRHVSKREKILFPLVVLITCIILLPSATPLIGALMFGNLARECGVVERLSDTMQNALMNIVTIMLGLAVGSKMQAESFLNMNTLGILLLGLIAFAIGTAAGLLLAKGMNLISKKPINPLIGAAGVSAVPMAARVVNKVGKEENSQNFLLMHAMGPNVAGVIGSAVAAGVLLGVIPKLAGG